MMSNQDMRYPRWLLGLSALVLVILSAGAFGQQLNTTEQCGASVDGIVLCLSRSNESGGFTLDLRNTGPRDALVNLGVMLANGARQYPTAITLTLSDEAGKQHHGVLAEPVGVAGRVDPLIVPLPNGASLRLALDISKYVYSASGHIEDFRPDRTKRYTVEAQFTGHGVTPTEANLDVKGIALMPYWTGTLVSNTVATAP
jgi:hypothetical protein